MFSYALSEDTDKEEDKTPATFDNELTLMTSSMAKAKLSAKDVHAPKMGPVLTASMIGNSVSKSALSILKQSLPA